MQDGESDRLLPNLNLHQLANLFGFLKTDEDNNIISIEPDYVEPHNFYWCRTEKNSNAEVDFIIQHHHDIIPIEVKSGKTGSLKSLQQFMYLKKRKQAVRINADTPSTMLVDLKMSGDESVNYQLLSIPFYLTEQLHRLL